LIIFLISFDCSEFNSPSQVRSTLRFRQREWSRERRDFIFSMETGIDCDRYEGKREGVFRPRNRALPAIHRPKDRRVLHRRLLSNATRSLQSSKFFSQWGHEVESTKRRYFSPRSCTTAPPSSIHRWKPTVLNGISRPQRFHRPGGHRPHCRLEFPVLLHEQNDFNDEQDNDNIMVQIEAQWISSCVNRQPGESDDNIRRGLPKCQGHPPAELRLG